MYKQSNVKWVSNLGHIVTSHHKTCPFGVYSQLQAYQSLLNYMCPSKESDHIRPTHLRDVLDLNVGTPMSTTPCSDKEEKMVILIQGVWPYHGHYQLQRILAVVWDWRLLYLISIANHIWFRIVVEMQKLKDQSEDHVYLQVIPQVL